MTTTPQSRQEYEYMLQIVIYWRFQKEEVESACMVCFTIDSIRFVWAMEDVWSNRNGRNLMFRLGEKIVDILNLLPHSGPNLNPSKPL